MPFWEAYGREDNVRIDIVATRYEGVKWIQLVQD